MNKELLLNRQMYSTQQRSFAALLATGVVILCAVSMGIGYAPLDFGTALHDVIAGKGSLAAIVLLELRIPRALLGALVGFSLGIAGAAMQGMLQNPLAEPGITGVTGAAAFGVVVVFYFGLSELVPFALPLGGVIGAIIATVLLKVASGRGADNTTIILAGVAVSSFSGALTALALNLSPNPYAATEIVFWLLGSLADRSLQYVWLVGPLMVLGWILLLASGRGLDGLSLGEDTARSLGFDVSQLRMLVILGTALAVGSSVAVSGSVGFVGLVVPHLLRPLVGYQPSRILLISGLGGACFTMLADILVRILPIVPELKLGVVTALIGAPFFLSLISKARPRS